MKPTIHLVAVMLITGTLVQEIHSHTDLLGCPDPKLIATSLTKLQQSDWRNVSTEQVMSLWPTPMDELKCEGDKPCRILVSKDRVISGHCECCVSFVFDLKRDGSSQHERLRNVIVHYSVKGKGEAIELARTLASAAGLDKTQVTSVGNSLVQRYEWDRTEERTYILQLQLHEINQHWELHLILGMAT